jgi:hypothetical protein
MLEGLFIDNLDTIFTLAILSTAILAGKWSWRLCSELPKVYDSPQSMQLVSCAIELNKQDGSDWILDARKQIAMSIRHKTAPDDEGDGEALLLS